MFAQIQSLDFFLISGDAQLIVALTAEQTMPRRHPGNFVFCEKSHADHYEYSVREMDRQSTDAIIDLPFVEKPAMRHAGVSACSLMRFERRQKHSGYPMIRAGCALWRFCRATSSR